MKTKEELHKEILETTARIQENYPELSKFADEMTITIPSEVKPEITTSDLQDYNDSLQAMATGYAGNKAVVDLAKPKLTFHGFFAWFIWMTILFFINRIHEPHNGFH